MGLDNGKLEGLINGIGEGLIIQCLMNASNQVVIKMLAPSDPRNEYLFTRG